MEILIVKSKRIVVLSLWRFLYNWLILMVIGYFVKFPHTDADIIAHLLFVFVIHMRQQVKHEMNLYQLE